jgi:RNA polymerase sigma-70 factor (ECF subfamily)
MEEWIRRAKQGDADALGQLWRGHQHLLLRYFRAKRMAEPEDLASIVWVEVASSLHRFDGSEHDFRRWLFTIAARRRIDEIRSTKRRDARAERLHLVQGDLVSSSAADDAERSTALDRAIDLLGDLTDDQREAITLRVIADLDVGAVAAIMGRREGTVRVLVHRGLKQLAARAAVTDPAPRTMSSS